MTRYNNHSTLQLENFIADSYLLNHWYNMLNPSHASLEELMSSLHQEIALEQDKETRQDSETEDEEGAQTLKMVSQKLVNAARHHNLTKDTADLYDYSDLYGWRKKNDVMEKLLQARKSELSLEIILTGIEKSPELSKKSDARVGRSKEEQICATSQIE